MKKVLKVIIVVALLIGVFYLGKSFGDPNTKLEYGSTGSPKNCRAIIYENYKGYTFDHYSAKEALDSIYRNCGENGYSWGNK
jgi:hypothetical protein